MREDAELPIGYMIDTDLLATTLSFPPSKMLNQAERRKLRSLSNKVTDLRLELAHRQTAARSEQLRASIEELSDQELAIARSAWEREMNLGPGSILRLESTTETLEFQLTHIAVCELTEKAAFWNLGGNRLRRDGAVGARKVAGWLTDLKVKQRQSDGTWVEVPGWRRRRRPAVTHAKRVA